MSGVRIFNVAVNEIHFCTNKQCVNFTTKDGDVMSLNIVPLLNDVYRIMPNALPPPS